MTREILNIKSVEQTLMIVFKRAAYSFPFEAGI